MSDMHAFIEEIVSKAPPLTETQRATIRAILSPEESVKAPNDKRKPSAPRQKFALYRYFDADGVLLYVGITNDLVVRSSQHSRHSPWMRFVERTETTWLPTRDAVSVAEVSAIRAERPLFNKQHANDDRDGRVLQYLIDNGATDLVRLP